MYFTVFLYKDDDNSVTHPSADTGTSDLPHPSVHVELKLTKQRDKDPKDQCEHQ